MAIITQTPTTLTIDTPVGPLIARVDEGGSLAALSFAARRNAMDGAEPAAPHPVLLSTKRQIDEYFAGKRMTFDVPLAPQGSAFYRSVWALLLEIPYGATTSYGEIAAKLHLVNGARAVGAANGANPIPIIIPCHRVIGHDGALVGYGGGLPRKRALLALESGRLELF